MFGIYLVIMGSLMFSLAFGSIIISRKSFVMTLIAIEAMLLSVNMIFVGFSYFWQNSIGQVISLFVISIGAAEIVIGLAIIVVHYHKTGSIFVDK